MDKSQVEFEEKSREIVPYANLTKLKSTGEYIYTSSQNSWLIWQHQQAKIDELNRKLAELIKE